MAKNFESERISVGPGVAKGTIANKITILGRDEWLRVQKQLTKREQAIEKYRFEIETREKLHQLSIDKTKLWKNTVQGKIQATLKGKSDRLAKVEEEKKCDDVEYALLAAENRRKVLEKARKVIYYETNRVRKFHSALVLSEILKERDMQVEYKRLKDKADLEARSRSDYADLQTHIEAFMAQSEAAAAKQRDIARSTARIQLEQMRERQEQAEAVSRDREREGQAVDRLRREFEEEQRAAREARRARGRQLGADNARHLALTRHIRDIERAQDEEADEAARHFARTKIEMMKKQCEKARDQALCQEKRLALVQAKINSMAAAQPDRCAYLMNAVDEKLMEEETRHRAAAQHRRHLALDAVEHMRQQVRRQEEERVAEKSRDVEYARMRDEAAHVLHHHEMDKLALRYLRDLDLARHHVTRAEEQRQQAVQEKQKLVEAAVDRQRQVERENDDFMQYAASNIAERQRLGRDTRPMVKAALAQAGDGLGPVVTGNYYMLPTVTPGHHGNACTIQPAAAVEKT